MKKIHTDSHRAYRGLCRPLAGEISFQVVVEETDLRVTALADLSAAISAHVHNLRANLKAFITICPEFKTSLTPVPVPGSAPEVARRMAVSSALFGIGPFAAVAGVIAQMTAETFHRQSPDLIIENGGDIYMYSQKDRVAGILSDPSGRNLLGVEIKAGEFPVSFCSSSGTIGHSFSFGQGDLVVVRSKDAGVADAAATALGNMLHGPDDVRRVLNNAKTMQLIGVDGVFAQYEDVMGIWGKMELTC